MIQVSEKSSILSYLHFLLECLLSVVYERVNDAGDGEDPSNYSTQVRQVVEEGSIFFCEYHLYRREIIEEKYSRLRSRMNISISEVLGHRELV